MVKRRAKGILINYCGFQKTLSTFIPDNGLACLAGALLKSDHEVRIIDYQSPDILERYISREMKENIRWLKTNVPHDKSKAKVPVLDRLRSLEANLHANETMVQNELATDLSEQICRQNLDFVGFKLWINPGYEGSLHMAELLRSLCPGIKLFAGGPHATIYHQALFQIKLPFDVVVIGEADELIVPLAEYTIGRRSLDSIGNTVHIYNSTTFISGRWVLPENIAVPNYTDPVYLSFATKKKIKIIVLEGSRGCNNRCHFCTHPVMSGDMRVKETDRFCSDLVKINKATKSQCYRFAGSSPHPSIVEQISHAQESQGGNMRYSMFLDVAGFQNSRSVIAKTRGCQAVFVGMETGSPRVRKQFLGKHFENSELMALVRHAQSQDVFVTVSIIFPLPYETERTRRATLRLLLELHPDSVIVTIPLLEPRTKWALYPQAYGFRLLGSDLTTFMINRLGPTYSLPYFKKDDGYMIGSFSLNQAVTIGQEFVQELQRNNIAIGITDEQAFMARIAGYEGKEEEYSKNTIQMLCEGDIDGVSHAIHLINERIENHSANHKSREALNGK